MKVAVLKAHLTMAIGWLFMAVQAQAISFDFANVANGTVCFTGTGDLFEFTDSTMVGPNLGYDFKITTSDSGNVGANSAVGLLGNLGGLFTIGSITISGPVQSAPVTSAGGTFSIFDGTNTLTADVAWIDIFTLGTVGGMNGGGVVNLTNISYAGAVADLQELATDPTGIGSIAFQFIPAVSLTQLTQDGATHTTSYNGNVSNSTASQVPEGGSTLALLGLVLVGVEALRRKLRLA